MATGGDDTTVKLWDASTGRCTGTLPGSRTAIFSVAFSPDGKTLATVNRDLWLWDLATGKPRTVCKQANPWVALGFDPKGRPLFASACLTAHPANVPFFCVWDPDTGKAAFRTESRSRWSFSTLTFSPDGKALATGGRDRAVQLWEVATGKKAKTLRISLGGSAGWRSAPMVRFWVAALSTWMGRATPSPRSTPSACIR